MVDFPSATRGEKILVTGYFDRGNLGDNAMRDALRVFLSENMPDARVQWHALPTFSPRAFWSATRFAVEAIRSDTLILAGGTHFHDALGHRSIRILSTFLGIFGLARLFRTQVVSLGVGIGPVTSSWGKRLVGRILALSSLTLVRDHDSFKIAHELGAGETVVEGFDLAATLPTPDPSSVDGATTIGICVVPYFSDFGGTVASDSDFVQHVADSISALTSDRPNLECRVLLCCTATPGGDSIISDDLNSALITRRIPTVIVDCTSYDQAINQILQTDLLIASRFHALVLGFMANKPMIAIPYQTKCWSLADEIELQDQAVISPEDSLIADRLTLLINQALDEPDRFVAKASPQTLRCRTLEGLRRFAKIVGS